MSDKVDSENTFKESHDPHVKREGLMKLIGSADNLGILIPHERDR